MSQSPESTSSKIPGIRPLASRSPDAANDLFNRHQLTTASETTTSTSTDLLRAIKPMPHRPSLVSHSTSLPRQGHIELNLKTVLQGIPVARLGFDPTQIPANVSTQLPAALIQPQLVSGHIDVSLRDVIDGCHERYRPAFAKASMDERITLPIDVVREQLPPSGAVLSPSEAESPFKPAGQGFRSPFSAADSPMSGDASPFKPASQLSASPFSPAGDDEGEEEHGPAEVQSTFRATETDSNPPFAAPAKPAASSPFSAGRPSSPPSPSPFMPAASGDPPSTAGSTASTSLDPSPFASAFASQGLAQEADRESADASPEEEDEPSASASSAATASQDDTFTDEVMMRPDEENDVEAPSEDADEDADGPLAQDADENETPFEAVDSVEDETDSRDLGGEGPRDSEPDHEDDRKPLSPFAMPPGSAKPRRKIDEEAEPAGDPAPAASGTEKAGARASDSSSNLPAAEAAPPSWPSGLRDQIGLKNGRPSPPAPTAASPAPANPAFDFGFQDDPKQLAIRAIFETAETLEVGEILDRTTTFRSLSACALIEKKTGETKFGHGADSGRDERFAQQAKQAYKKVIGLAEDLAITDAESFTLRTNRGAISFFNAPHICLAVLHDQYEFPPGIKERLILIARDLSAMEA